MMEIESAFPPASEAQIQQLHPLFKGNLPDEYRDFLLAQNGCTVTMFKHEGARGWDLRFLSVDDVLENYSIVEDMYYNDGETKEPDTFSHVPIATDDNSNYLAYELCLPTQTSFKICLVEHGNYPYYDGEEVDIRATDLEDLMNRLRQGVFLSF